MKRKISDILKTIAVGLFFFALISPVCILIAAWGVSLVIGGNLIGIGIVIGGIALEWILAITVAGFLQPIVERSKKWRSRR